MRLGSSQQVAAICLLVLIVLLLFSAVTASWSPSGSEGYCQAYYKSEDSSGKKKPGSFLEATFCEPITLFTLLIMGFTAGLTGVAILQAVSLSTANEVARKAADSATRNADALMSAERAHLFIEIVDETITSEIGLRISQLREGDDDAVVVWGTDGLRVRYQIMNHGKTPGVLKGISHYIDYLSDLPPEPTYDDAVPPPDGQHTLGAAWNSDPLTCAYRIQVNRGQIRAAAKQQCSVWFVARVVYLDIFGAEHVESVLWRYTRGGFKRDYRPAYNRRS